MNRKLMIVIVLVFTGLVYLMQDKSQKYAVCDNGYVSEKHNMVYIDDGAVVAAENGRYIFSYKIPEGVSCSIKRTA